MSSIYRSEDARRSVEERYRTFLERWTAPSTQTTVVTCEGDTFVVASGPADAPPLVLLHGAGFNSAAWVSDVATWAGPHRVYAVDLIGEPGLSAPSRPDLNSGAYAAWLDDVFDGLRISRAAVLGASLGGWIALDYSLRRPKRVTRLALLVPGGIGRQKYGALIGSLFLMPCGRRGRRAAVRLVLGPRPEASGPEADMLSEMDDFLLLIQRSYTPRRDRLPVFTDEQLRSLVIPVLVVAGDKDRMLDSHETASRVGTLVPDSVVTLLPGTGHIPTGYAAIIGDFLKAGGEA